MDTVYPFLQWLLESFSTLKTRGFLARYLVPFTIPEEYFADAQVVTMYQQYTMHQAEFKEVSAQTQSRAAVALEKRSQSVAHLRSNPLCPVFLFLPSLSLGAHASGREASKCF